MINHRVIVTGSIAISTEMINFFSLAGWTPLGFGSPTLGMSITKAFVLYGQDQCNSGLPYVGEEDWIEDCLMPRMAPLCQGEIFAL